MKRIPRCLAVGVLLLAPALAGCGSEEEPEATGSSGAEPSASASPTPGAAADGECGGGDVETTTVEAADGVTLVVPADWETEATPDGTRVQLFPPDREAGDGYVTVEQPGQDIDEAADDVLAAAEDFGTRTSEQDLELDGFEAARLYTYVYDDDGSSLVLVVAVDGELRVTARVNREGVPDEQPLTESCLSTLSRTA